MKPSTMTFAGVAALLPAAALAQTYSFEPPTYAGSAAGTVITGMDGWYLPPVASSTAGLVFTYAGNAPGLIGHPGGAQHFEAGLSGGGLFARAQHDGNFSSGGVWVVEYDVAVRWMGVLPAGDFVGSWSLQDSATARAFQTIMSWGEIAIGPAPFATNHAATAARFHQGLGHYTVASPTTLIYETPSTAWRDLLVNNWYRVRVEWDFTSATVVECGIQDLTGGGPMLVTDVSAFGWTLRGGPGSTLPLPTAMRLFAGNNALALGPANLCAFDNLKVSKVCYPDCNADGLLTVADFGCFQTAFVAGNMYADCNADGALTVADFGCFQTKFVAGCP